MSACKHLWTLFCLGAWDSDVRPGGAPYFGDCGAATCEHPGCLYTRKYDALLARLDQLGKGQT